MTTEVVSRAGGAEGVICGSKPDHIGQYLVVDAAPGVGGSKAIPTLDRLITDDIDCLIRY